MSAADESPTRIEPVRLLASPDEFVDLVAKIVEAATKLSGTLHPKTAANLADLVRIMNSYYSNRIEGHDTRPQEIEEALSGTFQTDSGRRDLQIEAAAHVRVQAGIDQAAAEGKLPEPADQEFIRTIHREFFRDAPAEMLHLVHGTQTYSMEPGAWRSEPYHDVAVGRHIPPSSAAVPAFMAYFSEQYTFTKLGTGARILAIGPAHHRFNFIHPFPDGNGRVARLMSHAMAHHAGIGAHGLWSISRGLARGIDDSSEYMRMMDAADAPRRNDLDGRGNLSLRALQAFTLWFLRVCLDQLTFMHDLFEFSNLSARLRRYVELHPKLAPETAVLLHETLRRGEIARGEIPAMLGLPERSTRRIIADAVTAGIVASSTPKGPLFLRFPTHVKDIVFPRLFG